MSRQIFNQAYTLIEMIVAVAIIAIMTAIVVGTYSFGKNYDFLKGETTKLASVLRNARFRDFHGVSLAYHSGCVGGTNPGAVCSVAGDCLSGGTCTGNATQYPPGGFGIYAVHDMSNRDYYILFADQTNGTSAPHFAYNTAFPTKLGGCTTVNPALACAVDTDCGANKCYTEFIQKIDLPDSIRFTGFNNTLQVTYKGSVLSVWQDGALQPATSYTVKLQHKNGCNVIGKYASVLMNNSGTIDDTLVTCP